MVAEAPAAPPRLPVLLVHGLGGFDQLRFELLKSYPLEIEYFKGIAGVLQGEGVESLTAPLPPSEGIEARAKALKSFADANISPERFHVVAHSMGGLDARFYVTHLGGDARVASLTTLGTPHRGSALAAISADFVLERFQQMVGALGLAESATRMQQAFAGHRDLRPDDCARFNAETPDKAGVAYFSWAGAPDPAHVPWYLSIPQRILAAHEGGGPNDGLVSVESAKWTGFRGTVPADHVALLGWKFGAAAKGPFSAGEFYRGLLPDLARAEQ